MSSARSRLARNVRMLLAKEGWNQVDLARRAGLSQGMISQLLAGEKGVRLSTLDRVAAALRVDVSALFAPEAPAAQAPGPGVQAAVKAALMDFSGARGDAERFGGKLLVDAEELRAIGYAIGYAIVEATQNKRPPVKSRKRRAGAGAEPAPRALRAK